MTVSTIALREFLNGALGALANLPCFEAKEKLFNVLLGVRQPAAAQSGGLVMMSMAGVMTSGPADLEQAWGVLNPPSSLPVSPGTERGFGRQTGDSASTSRSRA